jgi:uncharacterized protein (TIGR03437 family)
MPIRALLLYLCSGLAFAAAPSTFPALTYSTYLRDAFTPNAIATDSSGNIYLAGSAIVDPSTSQSTALVVKLNPQATQYLYVRYLGGSLSDSASAIAVDSAGNAYVAGSTASPDFPVTTGGNLGKAPTGVSSPGVSSKRSFVVNLDPNGELLFSDLLGGSASSQAQAVAVTASGQILVSGVSYSSGFPTTAGAYSIANSENHPYLLELDPTGTKIIFSATGIGGSALALDPSGNIYVAGTTYLLDYPTTPGAYQTAFPVFLDSTPPNPGGFQGANQYVTKVDPTGAKLIFSTSVSGAYNTTNVGLAVDSAGDVYLTGFEGGLYPFTVTAPTLPPVAAEPGVIPALPFLSKLDPAGQKLLFSVPVGGAGVQVDSKGSAYVGGMLGLLPGPTLGYQVASLPALAGVPSQCLPNATLIPKSSYASQVDAASGNVLGTQFIGGSTLIISAVALSGSTLWLAGPTNLADFPFSPGALTLPYPQAGALPGAYLGAVDFAQPQPPAGTPQIGCIVDAADLALAGPVAPFQLLTIFGTGLGPATGVSATDNTTGVLAGVDVSFGSTPAPLLYVSSTQINLAVPADVRSSSVADMQVTVNGVSSPPRELPITFANPSLFVNLPDLQAEQTYSSFGFIALALNADGSLNSASNPARLGSVVSVFVNGISPNPDVNTGPLQLTSTYGWLVTGYSQASPFVLQVDLQVPAKLQNNFSCATNLVCTVAFEIDDVNPGTDGSQPASVSVSGLGLGGAVYVTTAQ